MGASVPPESSWISKYLTDPGSNWLDQYFEGLQATGTPAASDATAVRSGVPVLPQGAVQPVTHGNIPLPRGSAQPLNPINRVTPSAIAHAAVDYSPLAAGKLGYQTAAALDQGDKGGALMSSLAALPMMIPGGSLESDALMPQLGDKFAVLTAENAGGQPMSAAENALRNRELAHELAQRGHTVIPVHGVDVNPTSGNTLFENSFLVHGMEPDEAKQLAAKYGQTGALTHAGYHNIADHVLYPTQGISSVAGDVHPHTEIPGVGRFAVQTGDGVPDAPPGAVAGGNPEIQGITSKMVAQAGGTRLPRVTSIDADAARHMANVYDQLPVNDPAARGAYDALNSEVAAQYKTLQDAGYKFKFVDQDPYKNSKEMMQDVRDNRTLQVLKTPSDNFHPYMTPTQNDQFRAVHDMLAHAGDENQFGPIGEENAYRVHASTLSPEAQQALATETRGQNSWVNYGPNENLPVKERPFAQQKAALFPQELLGDYSSMPTPQNKSMLSNMAETGFATAPMTPESVLLPSSGPGRVGTTPVSVAAARSQVGPQKFLQMVQDELARRGGPSSPEAEMAATEQVARNLASGNGTSALPAQTDIPRFIPPRVPQSKIDAVEDMAFKTYTDPRFVEHLRNGQFADLYNTVGTQQKAADALGPEGPQAYQDLMNKMGATTARSNPDNNLRRASYYYGLDRAGLLDPDALRNGVYKNVPAGMGHLANNAHHAALADLLENGSLNSTVNPKPASFVENLNRNFRPFTNDTRMAAGAAAINPKLVDIGALVKSVDPKGGVTYSPRDWAYAPMERAFQRAAQIHAGRGLLDMVPSGADPTAFAQAKAWDAIGGAGSNGGTFDQIFDQKLSHAAKLWGVSLSRANQLIWEGHPFDLPLNTPLIPRGLVK